MAKENAVLNMKEQLEEEINAPIDLDEFEKKLETQLKEDIKELDFLEQEKKSIGNPDNLGMVVENVIWQQFLNQIAATAGEDFINENRGLYLDLRKEAHIQDTENFAEGKIATHNTEIDYQERYNSWQANFEKDKDGSIVTHQTRTGKEEATLSKGARKSFDEGRPTGSKERHTDMDHTVSAGEIIRDPAANAHMTKEEQILFANSDANLYEMDSSLNRSKKDMATSDWLDTPNANGQKPNEIFDISPEEEAKLRQKDTEARAEYEKQKKHAEQKSIEAGKKSRKQEAFRIGGKALRGVLIQLLSELMREIIVKLVRWLRSTKKSIDTLLEYLKEAIHTFVNKMKTHLINATNTVFTTIATSIIGPIFTMIKKCFMMLKEGWNSLKMAFNYIKNPVNREKPIGVVMMEVGKIIIAGMTGIGAILLGETIEKSLMSIPVFTFEIPMLGSLANILGIFFGAVVVGIIGAIFIQYIEKLIEKRKKQENIKAQIDIGNKILNTQNQLQIINEEKYKQKKSAIAQNVYDRHFIAASDMKKMTEEIEADCEIDESIKDTFDAIDALFDEFEE